MKLSFPKTSHFRQKQQLCKDISLAYGQKAILNHCATGLCLSPQTDLFYLFDYQSREYIKEAERYEKRANSPFLYLVRESRLQQVLETLPVRTIELKYQPARILVYARKAVMPASNKLVSK